MKAIFNRPNFKSGLKTVPLLFFLVCQVLRERDHYRAHGEVSLAPIFLGLMLATMAVASVFYWLVAAVRRRMGRKGRDKWAQ